jgi:transcriptional regulator with XRE-family HTH domain
VKRPRRPNHIRSWRKAAKLTLVEVGERIGMSHAFLSKLERGGLDYTQSTLEKLADALDCSVSDLLFRDPDDPVTIWSIRERATDAEWREIAEVAETMLSFRRK